MSTTTVRVTIKDSGVLRILKSVDLKMDVGILPEDADTIHQASGLPLGELGAIHEFGVGDIPARMWLRGWADSKSAHIARRIGKELETMVRTQTFIRAPLDAIATEAQRSVQGRIIAGIIEPANAKGTLAKKAPETRPLIGDTQQFWHAIRAKMTASFGSGQKLS